MKQEFGNLMAEDPQQETINLLTYRLNAVTIERNRLDDQLDEILLRLGRTQEKMFDAERQRDRLAEALYPFSQMMGGHMFLGYEYVKKAHEAIQSLNQPTEL